MSFNIFNSGFMHQSSEVATMLSPQKEIPDMYPNEKSFLSDFNIEDELFAGMSGGGSSHHHNNNYNNNNNIAAQNYQKPSGSRKNEESILPLGTNRILQNEAKNSVLEHQQQIPHKNNALLNKLVGTKRRKLAPTTHEVEQQLQFDQYYEEQQNQLMVQYYPSQYTNESVNSSIDPIFQPPMQTSNKKGIISEMQTASGGCTGGATSYQSSVKDHQDYLDDPYNISNFSSLEIEEYKKVKKRMQNRESAVRSRMKKKAYYDNIETQFISLQKENNKLKLDNAALRAENQLLKRYLSYFENLFAKKTQSSQVQVLKDSSQNTADGNYDSYLFNLSQKSNQKCGGLSDDEIYNGKPFYPFNIRNRSKLHTANGSSTVNTDEICSQNGGDNEASRGVSLKLYNKKDDNNTEVSFVLERKINDSTGSSSPGKLGIFTIALVMCVCCFSSFFSPISSDPSMGPGIRHTGLGAGAGIGGKNLMFIEGDENPQQPDPQSSTQQQSQQEQYVQITTSFAFFCWSNLLKMIFLIFFAVLILTFPMDDIKQWAARKGWLRKIFNLNDIPIQASKNIKNL